MALRFLDHDGFHRAALTMVASGFCVGALAHAVSLPGLPPALVGGVVGAAIGVGLAHPHDAGGRGAFASALRSIAPRIAMAAIALVACGLLLRIDVWGALAACAVIAGVGLTVGVRTRRPLAMALGAVAVLGASWVGLRIAYAEQTATWPGWLVTSLASAAMSFVAILSLLPRHLDWVRDSIAVRMRLLPAGLDAEVRGLCDRSVALWTSGKDKIADDASRELLYDGVVKVIDVAARTAPTSAAIGSDSDLDERIAVLDERIAAATDTVTRDEYQAARNALDDQKRLRDRMRMGRERVVARMHNHVATLERFHLAAQNLEATRAADDDGTRALAADVASSSESLSEIDLPAAS
jgi:hypothetical protein